MFRWSILKYMENNPQALFSLNDLKRNITIVWNEMIAAGEIEIKDF